VIAGTAAKLNKAEFNSRGRKKPTNQLIYDIQMNFMEIYADLEKIIAQKKGYFRSLNGGRYNFTARNVIIPDPELRIDEIILPYSTLIELMSLIIINILTKTYSPSEAYRIWDEARIEYNPMIADLIQSIIDSQYVGIILNRNPSISPASIIQLHLIGVTKDDTYSCRVPHEILKSMGADFDGDTLNIISIKSNEFKKKLMAIFNPRNTMFISKNDGYVEGGLIKDQLIGLSYFCVC
jgi:DNA-directed RNA polymerase beta' subunit